MPFPPGAGLGEMGKALGRGLCSAGACGVSDSSGVHDTSPWLPECVDTPGAGFTTFSCRAFGTKQENIYLSERRQRHPSLQPSHNAGSLLSPDEFLLRGLRLTAVFDAPNLTNHFT